GPQPGLPADRPLPGPLRQPPRDHVAMDRPHQQQDSAAVGGIAADRDAGAALAPLEYRLDRPTPPTRVAADQPARPPAGRVAEQPPVPRPRAIAPPLQPESPEI